MILVVALVAAVLLAAILCACSLVQEHTIRTLQETIHVQAATERRLAANVRRLQEELVHHAVESQVITWWRNREAQVS